MWILLNSLPFGMMSRTNGLWIAQQIGEVIDVDVDKDGLGWGPFLRVNV